MRRVLNRVALLMLLATSLAVRAGDASPTVPPGGHLFIVVRHAEKASDDPRDPGLSAAGLARADRLAATLARTPLAAVYATPFRRTQLTAAPSARANGIAVQVREFVSRDPQLDATALRDELLGRHRGEAVLIVGHSNTVPAIVAVLAGVPPAPMHEDEFDRMSVVRIDAEGRAELEVQAY